MSKSPVKFLSLSVLTLAMLFATGCSYLREHTFGLAEDQCKSRAYIHREVSAYLEERFGKNAQVRMAVVPFTVPENLNRARVDLDYGVIIATEFQRTMLASALFPIVELLYRPDWAGKRDDFYRGNFGSIELARAAGYDIVLVGEMPASRGTDELTVLTKIIEVESGVTIWHGEQSALSRKKDVSDTLDYFNIENRQPSKFYYDALVKTVASCLSKTLTNGPDLE